MRRVMYMPPTVAVKGSPGEDHYLYRISDRLLVSFDGREVCFFNTDDRDLNFSYLSLMSALMFGDAFGLLPIHSAGIARSGRVVLIVGPGGSGKTTVYNIAGSLSFNLLHDDMNLVN
ncbi:MAG: hypothetical protein DRO11_09700, partial [Methanobacteriota archaeon]